MAPFRRIAAFAPEGVTALSLGIVGAVFAPRDGVPPFELEFCAVRPGPLRTETGLTTRIEHGADRLADADLVLLLPGTAFRDAEPDVVGALRRAHARGATVAAHCVGTFLLAATGLADGLDVTTHWRYAAELEAAYPRVAVRPGALYIDHGTVATGAGAAAGLDLCLHLLRRDHGAATANRVARDLVTPPHRDGGQTQYIEAPVPSGGDDQRLADVLAWARDRLDQRLTVDELAARALMSRRSFARRFKAATGATPHAWLRTQRLDLAEELLETTDLPVEEIARRVGYRDAAVLREQFILRRGVPPRTYRRTFAR
ncbi:GlxA family transcriptional regulator [Actinomadura opuntiae]|uniref:GlxA family transcriptional regulator n=1 Tax=Actinomadura sp. OS1-43 TaxID=604315 RepID=UPI00255B3860|nr:helix-turn-helix domain-containing protein [Actinomadura sp. OS1-43]MDL4817281.1 helix-turn-helix domain-containing protein [Actinomadura sp. OS1-43]